MSKVIAFLETLGQNADLRHATGDEAKFALARAEIAPDLQAALLSGDQNQLEALLGAKTNVVCAIFPGKEDDDEKKGPTPDDDEITAPHALRVEASAG